MTIRLFGPFAVYVENAPLPALRTRKGAWLLALLILRHPRPVERAWLAATLWPDSDPTVSLKNMRDSLYDLRKALGEEAKRLYSPTHATLAFDLVGAEVDLLTFDANAGSGDAAALDRAVSLYCGSLLEGCDEAWVLPERDRRLQMCLDALEALAEIESKNGMMAQAAHYLRNCVGLDPLRETAQRALMSALASAGDYAGAGQVYREFRLRLHEELQTSPAAETTALYEQIRLHARQAAAPTKPAFVPREPTSSAGQSPAYADSEASHNLPQSVTSFIGREREIEAVRMLLERVRLLTLIGAGGSGKTRLALQIAEELYGAFPDGVWLVELASLSDPLLVTQALASIFAVREAPGIPLLQTLIKRIASRHLLLVLDNCEHLLAACGQLVSALLRSCPRVWVLATSRERLGIAGEQTYRVPSLALPDLKSPLTVAGLDHVEAVRLFVDRARLSRSDFVLSAHNAPTVATLCHRLDGIPLALELAAARVRSLSVEDIVARLESRFDLLTGGDRTALPRHQTLRALIDWSYDLLTPQERLLLQRLSVFPGGWTLEAAEGVGAGMPLEERDILELLTSLVDKSLVLAEEREGSVRYRMFDTIRQYAAEKLHASGEAEAVFVRRRGWYLAFAQEASEAQRVGQDQGKWLNRLETEHDNLRAALTWSGSDGEGAAAGLLLAAALWRFWMVRGYGNEGWGHLRRALEREGAQERTEARSKALAAAGNMADNQGDYEAARSLYLQSITILQALAERSQEPEYQYSVASLFHHLGNLAVIQGDATTARQMFEEGQAVYAELLQRYREAGEKRALADALVGPGRVAADLGDYAAARAFHEENLALRRELADRRGIGNALISLGGVARLEGDYAAVRRYYSESIAIKQELGDRRGVALAYYELGEVAYRHGDYTASRTFYGTGLSLFGELGDKQHVALCLEGVAGVLLAQGEAGQAVRQWGSAAALRDTISTPMWHNRRIEFDEQIHKARLALSEEDFAQAWEEGQTLTWEQAALLAKTAGEI
ncbi:MAG TPA: BTAD domain-containing putative transcriptional regulator [Chthonomonadaceae bacterium]|nr:BTAD domain-containing putative transcriptional regulator [Chthonomonadaceae bacterium]